VEAVTNGQGRVLVSTYTINLQHQLISKDLPVLESATGHSFNAVLAKGRGNYLCRRRLQFALQNSAELFSRAGGQLEQIHRWSKQTEEGCLSDLDFLPSSSVWDKVNSEHGNCKGRRCKFFRNCFYQNARRKLETADIIVANHALLFSDLAIKAAGSQLLPGYKYVIIDEAHNIEHVAEDHFGVDVSEWRINFALNPLYNPARRKGLLAFTSDEQILDTIEQTRKEGSKFFQAAESWLQENGKDTKGQTHKNFIEDLLGGYLKKLVGQLSKIVAQTDDEDRRFELQQSLSRITGIAEDLEFFLQQSRADYIYWLEHSGKNQKLHLRAAALNVGEDLQKCLYEKFGTIVMTSATLCTKSANHQKQYDNEQKETGFEFFASRVGLKDYDCLKLGSPFDYENQVTVFLERNLPEPNKPDFPAECTESVKKYIDKTQGRAFVLFTSYSMLRNVSRKLSEWSEDNGYQLLEQGAGLDRYELLELFKEDRKCILLGTDSFWQGVDVPGVALSNVIITRLPFAVPDQPLLAGRLQQIREEGRNPFMDYQLPSAIIKFKQGFGRLIRTKNDTGIIAVLDSRIVNRRYGPMFLSAIPKCRIESV
jgi:ATP-dependent DNA helicase DinG